MIRLLYRILTHITRTPPDLTPQIAAAGIRDTVAEDHWAVRGDEHGLRDCDG